MTTTDWWSQQKHVFQNPNYPYARGYPLIEPPINPQFRPDDTVLPTDWLRTQILGGVTKCIVLNVRRIKYHRHESYCTQVLVLDAEGKPHWSHEAHFRSPYQ